MTLDTLYSIEVMPGNVRYYGVEVLPFHKGEEPVVAIPLKDLMEIMCFASETGEVVKSASIYDIEEGLDDDEMNKRMDDTQEAIRTILEKQNQKGAQG